MTLCLLLFLMLTAPCYIASAPTVQKVSLSRFLTVLHYISLYIIGADSVENTGSDIYCIVACYTAIAQQLLFLRLSLSFLVKNIPHCIGSRTNEQPFVSVCRVGSVGIDGISMWLCEIQYACYIKEAACGYLCLYFLEINSASGSTLR